MSWFDLPRVPEPEVMDDSDEVEAYSSAAAQAYLDKIDDTFVEHAVRLVAGRSRGRALDIGTGPGQIVRKLARRLPGWQFVGVDRSPNMIRQACCGVVGSSGHGFSRADDRGRNRPSRGRSFSSDTGAEGAQASALEARVQFFVGDGNRLPFPAESFDLVMCNSVLHHLAQPQRLLEEVARLARPDGAILIRDLRRPSRPAYPLYVRWHGRHYTGLMYKLYCASVRSAYTVAELEAFLRSSPLTGARVFRHARTHLGLERPAG